MNLKKISNFIHVFISTWYRWSFFRFKTCIISCFSFHFPFRLSLMLRKLEILIVVGKKEKKLKRETSVYKKMASAETTLLVIIDPQNDFHPAGDESSYAGSLAVTGALEDARNLAAFLSSEESCKHAVWQIFFPLFGKKRRTLVKSISRFWLHINRYHFHRDITFLSSDENSISFSGFEILFFQKFALNVFFFYPRKWSIKKCHKCTGGGQNFWP